MTLPTLGLVAGHEDAESIVPLLVALRAWCTPVALSPGVVPVALLATSPTAIGLSAALAGRMAVGVIVDEPDQLTDTVVHQATAIIVSDERLAHEIGDTAIVWPREALHASQHPSLSPFVRQRWRARLGLPRDFVIEIGTRAPTTLDESLVAAALATCSAAVVHGPQLVTALALGTPVVTDAASAAHIGATPFVHVGVAEPPAAPGIARELAADPARAAALGWGGRLLVEERFDLATVASELVDALDLGPASFAAAPLAHLDAELAALGTPTGSPVTNRALRRASGVAGPADWADLTGRRR